MVRCAPLHWSTAAGANGLALALLPLIQGAARSVVGFDLVSDVLTGLVAHLEECCQCQWPGLRILRVAAQRRALLDKFAIEQADLTITPWHMPADAAAAITAAATKCPCSAPVLLYRTICFRGKLQDHELERARSLVLHIFASYAGALPWGRESHGNMFEWIHDEPDTQRAGAMVASWTTFLQMLLDIELRD